MYSTALLDPNSTITTAKNILTSTIALPATTKGHMDHQLPTFLL